MRWKWFPWKYILRRAARSRGILDPVALLARLNRFGQPSEVKLPTELLRMGISLHARGLINNQAIQHNLDWVWPYWVEHQFDPADEAFIPRAFSLTHINLTHRNWTAIGLPSSAEMPLVDPAGLVTPKLDGWSIDGWIVPEEGDPLIPSCCARLAQSASTQGNLVVTTTASERGLQLSSRAWVERVGDVLTCRIDLSAQPPDARSGGWLVVSIRPYNPEGISFIRQLEVDPQAGVFRVDRKGRVELEPVPDRNRLSVYTEGDVFHSLGQPEERQAVECEVGMATGAALYRIQAGTPREVTVRVPLETSGSRLAPGERQRKFFTPDIEWENALEGACAIEVPEERFADLYRLALRALVLHSPGDVYPGPYTYKRFWFRDATVILHALLAANLTDRVEKALQRFFPRQTAAGYFHSQEGEWDSNGEVLWLLRRFCELSGRKPPEKWWSAIRRGAEWIRRKRVNPELDALHAGLLPAGFSAEHFGPNDYYLWDDFWAVGGLEGASVLARWLGRPEEAAAYRREASSLLGSVERTLEKVAARFDRPIMPASPYRRMDSGAIGSVAASYPLQLWEERDLRVLNTVEYLLKHCMVKGAFFHDMSHSGLNPYLTLHLAQVLLRAGDPRFFDLVDTTAAMASPTGQWPEAIHPRTMGGCMGDGQHIWAAAEWVLMMRNCFLREEGERLVLCAGIPQRWLQPKAELQLGPAPTPYGKVTVRVGVSREGVAVSCRGEWFEREPAVEIRLCGYAPLTGRPGEHRLELSR
jgi:hypothetical protein